MDYSPPRPPDGSGRLVQKSKVRQIYIQWPKCLCERRKNKQTKATKSKLLPIFSRPHPLHSNSNPLNTAPLNYAIRTLHLTNGLSVVLCSKEKLRSSVPECDDNWIQFCKRLQRSIEKTGKSHVSWNGMGNVIWESVHNGESIKINDGIR